MQSVGEIVQVDHEKLLCARQRSEDFSLTNILDNSKVQLGRYLEYGLGANSYIVLSYEELASLVEAKVVREARPRGGLDVLEDNLVARISRGSAV